MRCPIQREKGVVESRKAQPLSSSPAATRKFVAAAIPASRLSRWRQSPATTRTTSTSCTPNGTIAWPSGSFRSSRRRSPRAHISRWKATYPGRRTRAEDGHEAPGLGNSGRFDPEAEPGRKGHPRRSRARMRPTRSPPLEPLLLHSRKLSSPLELRSLGGSRYELRIDPAIP